MASKEYDWLVEQGPEIFEQFKGKWIAVGERQVLGVGETAGEAAARAREKKPGVKFLLEAIDSESDFVWLAA